MNIQYHFNVLHYQIKLQGEGGSVFSMMCCVHSMAVINCRRILFMLICKKKPSDVATAEQSHP